jgi:hypothetical protein
MAQAPIVKLYRNPWKSVLPDNMLLHQLTAAATLGLEELNRLIAGGWVDAERDSFGAVFLNPTRPREAVNFADRLLASIEIGPNGAKYALNGAAKADAHDRHGVPSELLVAQSHRLGDGDFAWGGSVEYEGAVAGGSGLSVDQDKSLTCLMLKRFITGVNAGRDSWLANQRRLRGNQRWFNPADEPGQEYLDALNQPALTPILT